MPIDKDLKRLVRARMARTGESYTTARAHITRRKLTLPRDYERRAGMSDDAVEAKTGRTWREWTAVLDELGATEMPHREIARWVSTNHELGGWWSQTVTVGYERIRGLRDIGQGRDGAYSASKARTLPYEMATVARAFDDHRRRALWLPECGFVPRPQNTPGVFRFTCSDGTRVEARLTPRSDARTQVAFQHGGLPSAAAVRERKALWSERLDALERLLAEEAG